jgi:glycosyl transferase family 87
MNARSESSYRRADAERVALAAALGVVLLTASWGLLHVGFYDRNQIIDTPVYQQYGDAMTSGEVPYRDFAVEYPPAALPVFGLPSLAAGDDYRSFFEIVMWVCAAATVVFVVLALRATGAGTERMLPAVAFVALAPLALGSVVLTRYDFWPAALTAAALAALLAGRERVGLGVLALAVAAKIYPVVLLPAALVLVWRREGARAALAGLGVFAAVLALALIPFAVIAPGGLVDSVETQLGRPLQIESLGASFLLAGHRLGVYDATVVSSSGSQNLSGALPDALGLVQTVLQVLAVALVWWLFASGRGGRASFVAACAATVAGFVAFGKVLSPQFLIWLIPLVPLVAGRLGIAASGLLGAALVTTQLWFPFRYWDVVALEGAAWLVLVRDLLLVALFGLLVRAIRSPRAETRSV